MKLAPFALAPLLLLTACTSVKVNKLTQGKAPKVSPQKVQQISVEAAKQRPHEKIATVDMRTRSPFAANLNKLARERTGKLGGNAYSILSGSSQTIVSGGVGSLMGDSTSASLSIEVLRWTDTPAPAPTPGAPAPTTTASAKPAKTKSWWRPWSWF
jgi:hypothetical protein